MGAADINMAAAQRLVWPRRIHHCTLVNGVVANMR